MRAFFDTNVLLDVLLERAPFYGDSARVWTLAETGRLEGYVSAVSFTSIFYIVRAAGTRADAEKAVRTMLDIFTPATCDAQVIRQAAGTRARDFEDAVQYSSALHAGAECILSRNLRGYPRRPAVPILSPTEFLAKIEMR